MSNSSLHSSATRESLLSRARARDSVAWNELVDLYGPLVAYWCERSGLDSHSSADCVQDVFIAVARALPSYRPLRTSGSFRAWLWTITANKIKDIMRARQRQAMASGGSTAHRALQQVPEDDRCAIDIEPTEPAAVDALVARGLAQVQGEFQQRTWEIFRRHVMDGVAAPAVAEEFDVSPAAVRQTRSRILRRLRQQLGDLD